MENIETSRLIIKKTNHLCFDILATEEIGHASFIDNKDYFTFDIFIKDEFRHLGFALEASLALIDFAVKNNINILRSYPTSEDGIKLLRKLHFVEKEDYYFNQLRFPIPSGKICIGNVEIKNRICLAPMAGICNQAFREIAHEMNAGLVYAEMVSDKALHYKNTKTMNMIKVSEEEKPISMQIFGSDAKSLVEAAMLINQTNADIIDINMGCPVNKVAKKALAGSALLKDPDKVYSIVKAVCDVAQKPVTVKIRSGWDVNSINAIEVAKKIEAAGASAIAIHPRTRSQMYQGLSDWNIIKEVKASVSIPVIGNGDIKSVLDAKKVFEETGCDMVMIGRKALGDPWIFKEMDNYFEKHIIEPSKTNEDIQKMIKYHAQRLKEVKCEKVALLEMRNHTAWYLKGLPNSLAIKPVIYQAKTLDELFKIVDDYFKENIFTL